MPQYTRGTQTQVKLVPRDGELEITLNINITIETNGSEPTVKAQVADSPSPKKEQKEDDTPLIPDFFSGVSLTQFGKKE